MANSNRVSIEGLGKAITRELTIYAEDVQERVNEAGRKAIKDLGRKTKATAPVNAKANHTHYASLIATKSERSRLGDETHTWYVKPPGHRLTHLLVNGHDTRDGGRTHADPFLANALADVLPEYEKNVEEAVT